MPASFRKYILKNVDSRYVTANVIVMSQNNDAISSLRYSHSPAKGLLFLFVQKLLCT